MVRDGRCCFDLSSLVSMRPSQHDHVRWDDGKGWHDMDARRVTDELSVSPQITVEDVAAIAAAGYRSILCNRPDGEQPGQTGYTEIEAAARKAGLEIDWQPVISGQVTDEDADVFADRVANLPAPVFAYCRSGTRCIVLWSLSEAGRRPVNEILMTAGKAGYDLSGLAGRLAMLAETRAGKRSDA